MTYPRALIEAIVKHPAVSRAASGHFPTGTGIDDLVRMRRALRDIKRAKRNAREEQGPATPENGVTGPFTPPGARLLKQALQIGGLPEDLRQMVETALAAMGGR